MMERGEMPQLARWAKRGASAHLRAEPEPVPAIVWTTIATGRGPEAHGIRATGARRLAGMKTPLFVSGDDHLASALAAAGDVLRITRAEPPSAVLRTVKTFWNIASEKGLRVGVVNWWATWPADPVNGYLISDRAFFKVERGEPFDRDVYPPTTLSTFAGLLAPRGERAQRLDLFYARVASRLREGSPPDLEALYLPGLDIFTTQQMAAPPPDLGALDARLQTIRDYYRFLDVLIGEFLGAPATNEVVVLVADPGRRDRQHTGGRLLVTGGPVQTIDLGTVSEREVAPTILHLLGLPISQELGGRVLEEMLAPSFREAYPVRRVTHYGRRQPAPAASGFDREMIEELRSLGYIQ